MWPQDVLLGRGACLARMPLYMHVVVVVEDRCDLNKWVVLHNGPKSLILAPQDIPEISGYQLGFACQCGKAYNNENPVTNKKIL